LYVKVESGDVYLLLILAAVAGKGTDFLAARVLSAGWPLGPGPMPGSPGRFR
jgi:hypothetical protein